MIVFSVSTGVLERHVVRYFSDNSWCSMLVALFNAGISRRYTGWCTNWRSFPECEERSDQPQHFSASSPRGPRTSVQCPRWPWRWMSEPVVSEEAVEDGRQIPSFGKIFLYGPSQLTGFALFWLHEISLQFFLTFPDLWKHFWDDNCLSRCCCDTFCRFLPFTNPYALAVYCTL